MRQLHWINPVDPEYSFPDVENAMREPDGLLAAGGDLCPERLLKAYRLGIFPWFSDGQPVLWWSPDPRMVLFPCELSISRSLRKTLRRGLYRVSCNTRFEQVIRACAEPRDGANGTWITEDMISAYLNLHRLGHAHSIESWHQGRLVGGLYGVAMGRVFFGESMFSRRSDASKVALAHLVRMLHQLNFGLIDCQVSSAHLSSLGAREISRREFTGLLNKHCDTDRSAQAFDPDMPATLTW